MLDKIKKIIEKPREKLNTPIKHTTQISKKNTKPESKSLNSLKHIFWNIGWN